MTHVKKIECRRRSRKWCFTVNNYTDEDLDQISSLNTQYLIYGRERGEEGTDHIQGFAIFRNAVTFSSLKSKLPRAHIEVSKGSTEDNIRLLHQGGSTTFYSGNTTTRETARKRKRSGNFGEGPIKRTPNFGSE